MDKQASDEKLLKNSLKAIFDERIFNIPTCDESSREIFHSVCPHNFSWSFKIQKPQKYCEELRKENT